ncbi:MULTISPECIES: hypothetical protein [Pseudonocardia]|uniref:DUF3040 domain-containing protein n=2 Tax=Pseudonocardia TaxID=1847 RepID=A0A1Y2MHU3_PSEAH|nr:MULTISPECIES: hypothetical protein [Pseudonocardia]OSY34844.1 hypothetical protein BG845_06475 [Pseudonocardia autotrophica]TDN75457.1 hypothetical protein C8E95_4623 [Pseudonocardia autotrophica]BBF99423.1 hypothetical protein Pdca_06330 [Pseudonocardia autotrophica]GEC29634.1 hypothetical protein PSA01_66630 [Pseudonocardia saturnea]
MLEDRPARPLDPCEMRVLAEISAATLRDDPGLVHRLDGVEGRLHPPVAQTGTPLAWPLVLGVMTVAVLYALVIVMLPPVLALSVVLGVQLVLVPAGCLIWARRRGEL